MAIGVIDTSGRVIYATERARALTTPQFGREMRADLDLVRASHAFARPAD